ncbi:MAG: hypothetical protein R3B84_16665 [Zavarzinella sp.]
MHSLKLFMLVAGICCICNVAHSQDRIIPLDPLPLPADLGGQEIIPAQFQVPVPAGTTPTGGNFVGTATSYNVPTVTLNVAGPSVVSTEQPIVYRLTVRNVSRNDAHHVVLRVIPPKGTNRIKSDPPPTKDEPGEVEVRYEMKTLAAGESKVVEISFQPKSDTTKVQLKAWLQFDYGRGLETEVSPPALEVKKDGPTTAIVGDTLTYRILVKNTGKVTLSDVVVQDRITEQLAYDDRVIGRGYVDGRVTSTIDNSRLNRSWTIPKMLPGATQILEYQVKVKRLGKCTTSTTAECSETKQKKTTDLNVDISTAQLGLEVSGPTGEAGTVGQSIGYRAVVRNAGTADLKNVVVRFRFPTDMETAKATAGARLNRDAVEWTFDHLLPNQTKEVNLMLQTSTPGQRNVLITAVADRGEAQKKELSTTVKGVAAIDWDVSVPGTVAVGNEVYYQVTIINQGTATAPSIRTDVDLPKHVELLETNYRYSRGTGENARLLSFQAMDIPPRKKTTLTIRCRAVSAGEAKAAFTLTGEGVGRRPLQQIKTTLISGKGDTATPVPPPPRPETNRIG